MRKRKKEEQEMDENFNIDSTYDDEQGMQLLKSALIKIGELYYIGQQLADLSNSQKSLNASWDVKNGVAKVAHDLADTYRMENNKEELNIIKKTLNNFDL